MDLTFWHKQTIDSPLFPDLQWSRPENRSFAGKLAIIGGNLHGFAAAAESFAEAEKAGVGVARVLLPDSLQKTVGRVFEAGEYAPSTPSGSFSKKALTEALQLASWSDAVLLAGDLGRNSETAIIIESFINKYSGELIVTKDAVNYVIPLAAKLVVRPNTTLVLSFAQLQKLATNLHLTKAYTFDMGLVQLVQQLHELTSMSAIRIEVKYLDSIVVAVNGQVSSTNLLTDLPVWRVKAASHASVWLLQNPSKPFEAITTSVLQVL